MYGVYTLELYHLGLTLSHSICIGGLTIPSAINVAAVAFL